MSTRNARRAGLTMIAILMAAYAPAASALTITRVFNGGTAATGTTGTGTLASVFNWAADQWEALIPDPHALTITFSWASLGGTTIGAHNLVSQGGVPNRETAATIRFDNDNSQGTWFLDGTPGDNVEYAIFNQSDADLGGGIMSTGLTYSGALGPAVGQLDLLTVALHEIGHALGLSAANTSFQTEAADSDVDVTSGIFAGAVIPITLPNNAHVNIGTALMFPSATTGQRSLISDADLMANCQISQFADCLAGAPIPEPSATLLFAVGVLVTACATRRRTPVR